MIDPPKQALFASLAGRDTPDLITRPGKPEITIGPRCDPIGNTICARQRELGDSSPRGTTPNLTLAKNARKPEIAIGTIRDRNGTETSSIEVTTPSLRVTIRVRDREFSDCTCGGNAPDPAGDVGTRPARFGQPEMVIGTTGNHHRDTMCSRDGELSDLTSRGNAPDLASLSKPEIAIRPAGDPYRETIRAGDKELGELSSR